ncbi:hypothetical protein G9A89_010006 [Geosiphon pyriformis]|nr:hypothetical protein G9A89_010006 [Geosiphon pyriformis]
MTLAKIEGALPEEIRMIKNNPPKPIELDWDPESVINLLDPEQFYKHYQELALTKEESSLAKRGINIKGEIIDAGYIRNIIAMLQNDSKKAYIIELNKKIAQAIFLSLVKIA